MAIKEKQHMDYLDWARQLIEATEAAKEQSAERMWNQLLDSPEFGLRELIEDVGIDLSEAKQVLTDARIGNYSALFLIVLGRNAEVREALLRMLHGHH
jgi:hypothetical protein